LLGLIAQEPACDRKVAVRQVDEVLLDGVDRRARWETMTATIAAGGLPKTATSASTSVTARTARGLFSRVLDGCPIVRLR
jgi:hypothetical protein